MYFRGIQRFMYLHTPNSMCTVAEIKCTLFKCVLTNSHKLRYFWIWMHYAVLPKLTALFPNYVHSFQNWPEKGIVQAVVKPNYCCQVPPTSHEVTCWSSDRFLNMDVAESDLSNESLRFQAVGMVMSGLAQGKTATRVGLTPGSSPTWTRWRKCEKYPAGVRQRGAVHQRPATGRTAELSMGKCSVG